LLHALYSILSQHNEHIALRIADDSHPIFKAHFPDFPLLPGFAIIDIIAEILEDDLVSIKYSKFLKSIYPNDTLECTIQHKENTRKIQIFRNKEKVSEIVYDAK